MDTYGASGITLLFIACAETVVIGWVYGEPALSHDGLKHQHRWLCEAAAGREVGGSCDVTKGNETSPRWLLQTAQFQQGAKTQRFGMEAVNRGINIQFRIKGKAAY